MAEANRAGTVSVGEAAQGGPIADRVYENVKAKTK